MRSRAGGLVALVLPAVAVVATLHAGTTNTSKAQEHLRKACELVWAETTPHQVERCTERAMAALSDHNRLRDYELKRMLVDSESDLETCKEELDEARSDLARHYASNGRGHH